jgi:hypothetical protein
MGSILERNNSTAGLQGSAETSQDSNFAGRILGIIDSNNTAATTTAFADSRPVHHMSEESESASNLADTTSIESFQLGVAAAAGQVLPHLLLRE